MTENVENLILEHLKALRSELRGFKVELRADMGMVVNRLNSLEKQTAFIHSAGIHARLDRFDSRLDRVERRLDLA